MPDEEPPKENVKGIMSDFSGWTSAHGIPHIGRSRHKCMITFWVIITLLATGLLVWQVVMLVIRFLRYDVTVGMELKFERREFPAVTICDLNPYKNSSASDNIRIQELMDAYDLALKNASCAEANCQLDATELETLTKFGLHGITDSVALQSKTRDLLVMVMQSMTNPERQAISNPKEQLIKSCSFNTKDCSIEKDFTYREDKKMGSCYTFNGVERIAEKPYTTSRAGPLYGLRLILFSNTSDYLPITESAGLKVVIHAKDQEPFPDTYGYNVEIGSATSMGVSYRHIKRLGAPYGECVQVEKMTVDYSYNGSYTSEGCQRTCFQRKVEADCGCSDPNYKEIDKIPCDPENKVQRECWYGMVTSTAAAEDTECLECNLPCTEGVYDVTVSAASWPSPSTIKIADCMDNQVKNEGQYNSCIDLYNANGAMVEVFYEQLNYQALDESPAYEFVNLASDFGGQIGLWLGLSAISIVEFIVLFGQICFFCCKSKKA